MSNFHEIKHSKVTGNGTSVVRAVCSCGFRAEAPRLSTALRRKMARQVAAHRAEHTQAEAVPC